MSIFISWRGIDRDSKNYIVSEIKKQLPNEIVWESDENCMTNFSKECMDAINKCEVFVALISSASMKMSYMLNEIIAGRTRENDGHLNMLVYKLDDSEYTPEFSMQINHIPDSNYLGRLYNDDSGIKTLVSRIKFLLERRRNGNPEKPLDVNIPEIDGNIFGKNRFFVSNSRESELIEIENAFDKSNVIVLSYMDGYGKKSTLKKYIEINKNVLSKSITFNMFEGSLMDFVIKELNFTNVNPKIFENLINQKLINKKIEFLNKIKEDTIIIVPNILFNDLDEEIIDLFDDIKCKLVLITQTIPTFVKEKWPTINIKSLKQEELKELFYHYGNFNDFDKELINKSLEEFIDNVDGHTKTIELTSRNISNDITIETKDIPNILNGINTNSDNDLSKRIFEAIASMFDVRKFNDLEKNILLAACLLCQIPFDEKDFALALKKCNSYDNDAINKLISLNWLDRDQETRTISIEKLLAKVCLNKLSNIESDIDEICLKCLVDKLSDYYINGNYNGVKLIMKRIAIFFTIKGFNEFVEVINLFVEEVDYSNNNLSKMSYEDALQRINIFKESYDYYFESELMQELFLTIIAYLNKEINMFKVISNYKDDKSYSNTVIASVVQDESFQYLIDDYLETIRSTRLKEIINDLLFNIVSGNSNVVYEIMRACNDISKFNIYEYEDELKETYSIMLYLLYNIIILNRNNSYLCAELAKKYIEITDLLDANFDEYDHSKTDLLVITTTYFDKLIELMDSSDELDNTFEDLMYLIDFGKDNVYQTLEDYYDVKSSKIYYYAENLCLNNKINKLIETNSLMKEIPLLSDLIFENVIYYIDKVFRCYLDHTLIDEAKEFISEFLTDEIVNYKSEDINAINILNDILHTKETLFSPTLFDDFTDKADEYETYYKAFQLEYNDKKSYLLYTEIAKKAKEVDYSKLNSDEIKTEVKKLKMQASLGMKWEVLAPKAFALVSEVGYRILGYRHHLVQYIGGAMLLDGKIAEIYNGEGKTYTIVLAAFVKYLYNKKVRIIDSNEYLVERNYKWMKGVLEELGCKVGLLLVKTIAFPIDSYDVVYEEVLAGMYKRIVTEFKNTKTSYDVAIVDEADLTIVENASKPMYSNSYNENVEYRKYCEVLYNVYKTIDNSKGKYWTFKNGRVALKKEFYDYLSEELKLPFNNIEQKTLSSIEEIIIACIEVNEIFSINKNYYIINNRILVENRVTGKLLDVNPLYKYMIAKKEGLIDICEQVKFNDVVINNFITVFEYIKGFDFVCGTTATASSMEHEFKMLYDLNVVRVPTNIPIKRTDNKPLVFYDFNAKMKYIIDMIIERYEKGQPILLLSNSISESQNVSKMLKDKGIDNLLINGANIENEAHLFNESGRLGMVTVSTSISNRGVDIVLGGNYKAVAKENLIEKGYPKDKIDKAIYQVESNDALLNEIREKYNALCSLYKMKADEEKEKILSVGGLCVIGTSCFEDLRIEQQLRGRAGRQGQEGESFVFYSFKDPNFQKLLGSSVAFIDRMMVALGDEAIDSKMLNSTVARSRRILQNRTYEHVLSNENIVYYQKYRKELIDFKNSILDKKLSIQKISEKYFINNPKVLDDIKDYLKTYELNNVDNKQMKKYLEISLGKKITELSGLKDKQIIKSLEQFIKSYVSNNPDSIFHNDYHLLIIEFALSTIWKTFISKMDIEIKKYRNNQMINQNKKNKLLGKFAQETFENVFYETICMILFVKIRKNN